MNILYITHTDSLGGANRSLLQLIKGITDSDDGIIVFVILPTGGADFAQELTKLNCRFMRYRFGSCITVSGSLAYIVNYYIGRLRYRKILKEVRKLDIDIIHTNSSVCDLGMYLADGLHIPHVWHARENLDYYDMRFINPNRIRKMMESSCNHVVCISEYIRGYIDSNFNVKDSRVIYNGFSTPNRMTKSAVKGVHNLIVAGMIYKNKGQIDAIKAVCSLVNKYGRRDICLYIVGMQPSTRQYESELMDYVKEHQIEQYVKFMPFTTKLDEIREKCDIALQCSIMEGMGRITIESMLCQLIVIGARSGATTELIENGENGWLYEPGDSEDLAERIDFVLDYEARERVRKNAYEWAKANFDNEIITAKFKKLYGELLEG